MALYSHDTQGLGHIRRNIGIAAALAAAEPDTDVLLLTGAPEATALPLPPATDVVTLPTLHKSRGGTYTARRLGADLDQVLRLRSRIITAALTSFAPDLFIVDKVARGVHGELDTPLAELRRSGPARTVLGLRDILDAPCVARREWTTADATAAVDTLYDAVWVYGDRRVFDQVAEYALPPAVARKVVYTGYLVEGRLTNAHTRHRTSDAPPLPDEPFVLCLVGGGQDGLDLAQAFLRVRLPAGHHGVLLTGPYMHPDQRLSLLRQAAARPDMTVHEFVADTHPIVARAAAAASMGGYNSVCELLAAGCPTLLVPRVVPRTEQALRAERLAHAGWVDVLAPAEATPARLSGWLGAASLPRSRDHRPIDLGGLSRIPWLAAQLLGEETEAREVTDVAV